MARAPKDTRWGLPLPQWEVAREQLRAELVARARTRETVTYSQACEAITVAPFRAYSWRFMALLDEVCREEDALTGVVLASLVVRKDAGIPGEGYFAWAEREGADVRDREAFWNAQAQAVWDAYAEPRGGATGA